MHEQSILRGVTNKEVKAYLRLICRKHGFALKRRKQAGIVTLICPDGRTMPLHTTSSSHKAVKHLAKRLRDLNYDVPTP